MSLMRRRAIGGLRRAIATQAQPRQATRADAGPPSGAGQATEATVGFGPMNGGEFWHRRYTGGAGLWFGHFYHGFVELT